MSKDVIGDFLTIIRNGIMITKPAVEAPYSKIRFAIAEILKEEGFVHDVRVIEQVNGFKAIRVQLKYVDNESVIHEIKRISKPSCRTHSRIRSLKPVISGLGISILSTDKGILSHKQAEKFGVGGEVLCTVW